VKKIFFVLLAFLFLSPAELLAACNITSISLNSNKSGSWSSSCTSNNNPGAGVYYAQYYTFTLANAGEVTIDLTSSEDTYLILLDGTAQSGTVIAQDDDSGNGTNSRITKTLSKNNTYTIEVTTYEPETTGNFVVTLSGAVSGNCIGPIDLDSSESDSWEPGCPSENNTGAYAKYFTFTLSSSRQITIDLTSSKDTLLFLLSGSGQTGSVIEQDDDSGNGTNSKIVRTLSAGTYTIEATTYELATTGNFVVSLSISATPCTDCPFLINAGLNDAWYNPATDGQGFAIIVFPELKLIWVAWFTFDTERPPGDVTALLGEPGHRWLTAEGHYNGDTAQLTIFVTKGGVFDAAQPAASTDLDGDGTMTIEFSDCAEGLVTYTITSLGISGEIPIQRLSQDNVPLCEMLWEDMQ